jgi:hypothetical protein
MVADCFSIEPAFTFERSDQLVTVYSVTHRVSASDNFSGIYRVNDWSYGLCKCRCRVNKPERQENKEKMYKPF